jgi:hypothetical protein
MTFLSSFRIADSIRDGSFDYLSAMPDVMMGYKGNVILVNGTIDAHLVLRRQRTRLRLLNASNSRIYTLGRDDGVDLLVSSAQTAACWSSPCGSAECAWAQANVSSC